MTMPTALSILDVRAAPSDPLERIIWLDGVMKKVQSELDEAYAEAYFTARLQGLFEEALRLGRTSRKRALKFTRQHNEATGRTVRWNDNLDPYHSG